MIGLKFVFLYVIPLLGIGTFYVLMARRLWDSSEAPIGDHNETQVRQLEMRKKLAKMVLALVVMFALSFLPSYVFFIWFYFTYPDSMKNYNDWWHFLKIFGYVMTFVNSASNPVILYFISGKFRLQFRRHVLPLCLPCCPTSVAVRYRYRGAAGDGESTLATGATLHHQHNLRNTMTLTSNTLAAQSTIVRCAPAQSASAAGRGNGAVVEEQELVTLTQDKEHASESRVESEPLNDEYKRTATTAFIGDGDECRSRSLCKSLSSVGMFSACGKTHETSATEC